MSKLREALFSNGFRTQGITFHTPHSPFEQNRMTYQEASTSEMQVCTIKLESSKHKQQGSDPRLTYPQVPGLVRKRSSVGFMGTSTCLFTDLGDIRGLLWIPLLLLGHDKSSEITAVKPTHHRSSN